MKLVSVFLLFLLALSAAAASLAANRTALRLSGKQRRWTAEELRAHHEAMRKVHRNYVPDYPDAAIYAQVDVGTPPQTFTVMVETAGVKLLFLDKTYSNRKNGQPFYDPSLSSTSKLIQANDFAAMSGDLQVIGDRYSDVVSLFGFNSSARQQFGAATEVYSFHFNDPEMPDGVLGLSWDSDHLVAGEEASPVVNLFAEYPGVDRFWCQWIEPYSTPGSSPTPPRGEAGREYSAETIFGGCDDELCEEVFDVVPLYWWPDVNVQSLAFLVDGFFYNDKRYVAGFAHVDTGFPIVQMPLGVFEYVFWDVNPDYDFSYGIFTVPCSSAQTLPDWTFMIGQKNYTVPASAYVVDLQLPGEDQCSFALDHLETVNTDYVLGLPFHTLYCIKMNIDGQTIGFSPVVQWTPEVRK